MMTAEELIDLLVEYRKMPAAQRMAMMRARKKPKVGKHAQSLRKRRKAAKKPMARMKVKRYRRRMKASGH
jgi:hypothetical protein